MAQISMYDPAMLIWLDETGCDRRNRSESMATASEEFPFVINAYS